MAGVIEWTRHATERQRAWQMTHGITRAEVEKALSEPDQEVDGDQEARVAQIRPSDDGLLRVVFVRQGDTRRILTVYWTSKTDTYWRA